VSNSYWATFAARRRIEGVANGAARATVSDESLPGDQLFVAVVGQ
jgi:hypothetical protein